MNAPDTHLGTPLHVASREGHADIAQQLIANGAVVDARWVRWSLPGDTPLHEAVRYNRPDVIAVLLAGGADIEAEVWYRSTPLELAVRCGAWEAARLLIAQGAAATIHHAAHLGNTDLVRRLIDGGANMDALDSYYETPLHIAAQAGWTDVATLLLSRGARVDTPTEVSRETPLHYASEYGHADVTEVLLSHGADIRAKTKWQESTPLHNAVIYGREEVAELLLAHGADIHTEDKHGHTPLCEAPILGDVEMAELLLTHGADINGRPGSRWTFGGTPLHEAIYYGHTEMAAFLLARGADAGTTASKGATALDYAIKQSFPDVVALLGGDANDPALANREPWTVIVTDPQGVREFLSFEGIDYDEAWIPEAADIADLESSLRSYLLQNANIGSWMWFDRAYVLANLRWYNREYSGFVLDDARYIICNMILSGLFQGSAYIAGRDGPPGSSFTIIFDGGCAIVRVIFDAQTKTVVGIACNGMA